MQQTDRLIWQSDWKHIVYLAEIFLSQTAERLFTDCCKDSALTNHKPLEFSLWCTLVTTWASTLLTLQLYRANYDFHASSGTDQNRNLNLWKRVDIVRSESGFLHVGNTQTGYDSDIYRAVCQEIYFILFDKMLFTSDIQLWPISFSFLVAKLRMCMQVVSSVSKDVKNWASRPVL